MDVKLDMLTYSPEEADRIFEELKGLEVGLDADPLVYGPKRLNQKVSEVRHALGRCERLFLDISQRHHAVQRLRLLTSADLEIAKKDMFANDPDTRAGRSVSDREAIAAGKLREQVVALRDLDLSLQSLDAVLTVIKTKRSDLRDTQSRLRDQIRLCQEEIGLGGSWGSKVHNAAPLKPVSAAAPDHLAEIDSLLGRVDGVVSLGIGLDEDEEEGSGFTETPPTEIEAPVSPVADPVAEALTKESPETIEISPMGSDRPAEAIPSDSAPVSEVDLFMEGLPDDLLGFPKNKPATVQPVIDDALEAILESFEDVK